MTRTVQTFDHSPLEHILESETVDYDSRTFAFTLFAHEDPNLITLHLGKYEAMRERGLNVASCSTNDPDFVNGRAIAARWVRVNWKSEPNHQERVLADWVAHTDDDADHQW